MWNILFFSVIVICNAVNGLNTADDTLLQTFTKHCKLPQQNSEEYRKIKNALEEIISTKDGKALLRRIVDIYSKQETILEKGLKTVSEAINRYNLPLFTQKELSSALTINEENEIKLRNRNIRKAIIIHITNNKINQASYIKNKHAIYFRDNLKDTFIIQKDGRVAKMQSTVSTSLIHELLHLYHFLSDPITTMRLSNYAITKNNKYRCEHIGILNGLQIAHLDSWQECLSAYGIACIPYFNDATILETNFREDQDEEINVNCEELLTIRGKQGTLYDISENSYRLEKKQGLRYSHIDNLIFDGCDAKLYDNYYNEARRI